MWITDSKENNRQIILPILGFLVSTYIPISYHDIGGDMCRIIVEMKFETRFIALVEGEGGGRKTD